MRVRERERKEAMGGGLGEGGLKVALLKRNYCT